MNYNIFKFKKVSPQPSKLVFTIQRCWLLLFFLVPFSVFSQEKVTATADSTEILIGEKINYRILVETAPNNAVIFPEDNAFAPLEIIESFPVDTNRAEGKFLLLKEYALTQFDSGQYVIPRQQVLINNRKFFTDSIPVTVNNVVVDTTKQKLYNIKPYIEVPKAFEIPLWAWWVLGILIILGLLIYFLFRRKKRKEAEAANLPPYEQALVSLQQLDHSHLLENRELKEYYSQLTAVVRTYLDGQVYDHAMESTTGELIAFLKMKKDAGELQIPDEVIKDLQVILQRADLAKFANSKPDVLTAKADRAAAEKIINETKTAVPEPTEEELLKDQRKREELERKKKRRKIVIATVAGTVILLATIGIFLSTQEDFDLFTETSEEMLQGEWIQSEYGTPSMSVAAPFVLVRQLNETDSTNFSENKKEIFSHGGFIDPISVKLISSPLGGQKIAAEEILERATQILEVDGAKNILLTSEEFSSIDGTQGTKISGTFTFENPETTAEEKRNYIMLNFVSNNSSQTLLVTYEDDDENLETIAQRIVNSVEFKNTTN